MKLTLLFTASAVSRVVVTSSINDTHTATISALPMASFFFPNHGAAVAEHELTAMPFRNSTLIIPTIAPGRSVNEVHTLSPTPVPTLSPTPVEKYNRYRMFPIDCDHGIEAGLDTTCEWLGKTYTWQERHKMIPYVNTLCRYQMEYAAGEHDCEWMRDYLRKYCAKGDFCKSRHGRHYVRHLERRYCGKNA